MTLNHTRSSPPLKYKYLDILMQLGDCVWLVSFVSCMSVWDCEMDDIT